MSVFDAKGKTAIWNRVGNLEEKNIKAWDALLPEPEVYRILFSTNLFQWKSFAKNKENGLGRVGRKKIKLKCPIAETWHNSNSQECPVILWSCVLLWFCVLIENTVIMGSLAV